MLQLNTPLQRQRVCVGICTYRRPTMLTACLESVMTQMLGNDIRVDVVVIDNELRPNNRGIVETLAARSPIPLHYIHEPRRGIACARNRVITAALSNHSDCIVFIDDDEIADPFWLMEMTAPNYADTPILQGQVLTRYPDPLPFWVTKHDLSSALKGEEGATRKTAATGNLRMNIEVVKDGLRFNEDLRLMGGEDNELLTLARLDGFEIRRTLRGIVTETAHPERLTYFGRTYRAYWCAASDMRRTAIIHGRTSALLRQGVWVPLRMAVGIVELAASPLFIVLGLDMFKRRALAGGKKLAKGFGRIAAMVGHLPQPYARTHGH